ncbi:MAG TPA: glycoside hydrolase family 43 protein [Vicinamibacteria bacterium]|nr:glycoside hydrolase family 43 protein [Vicinamibacteria bacterium]
MRRRRTAFSLVAVAVAWSAAGAVAPVRSADRVVAYRNPVIPGFHPDPSVVRVGGDYYLVNSSFEFFPGVPLFHSRDLVHWRPLGHVLTRDSQLPLAKARASGGIFAPTIRHHDGTFYMITTNVDGGGSFYVTAKDPAGPWSEPHWVRDQGGIDPSLFFDDDGTAYLTTNGGAPGGMGPRGIYQSTIDLATGKLLTPPRHVWAGTGGRYPEGPHLYKIRGRYYLMISEGGTEYGHMMTIARADSPWGPFEPCPRNPFFTHRDTEMDVPIQGTGHADLVQDHEGSWWMVFLAFRPVGGGYWHHLGRETYLAPVTWDADGWPVVNEGKVVTREMTVHGLPSAPWPEPHVRTDFVSPLGPEWTYLRNPNRTSYTLDERPGWLTLRGDATSLGAAASPTWIGRRQEHLACEATTRLDFVPSREGEEAGLAAYRSHEHRYEIAVGLVHGSRRVFVRQTVGPSLQAVTASAPAEGREPVVLRIEAAPGTYAFSFGLGDAPRVWTPLGTAPTRFLSTEVASGFTGAFFALYATGGDRPAESLARFDWFEYEPRPE